MDVPVPVSAPVLPPKPLEASEAEPGTPGVIEIVAEANSVIEPGEMGLSCHQRAQLVHHHAMQSPLAGPAISP